MPGSYATTLAILGNFEQNIVFPKGNKLVLFYFREFLAVLSCKQRNVLVTPLRMSGQAVQGSVSLVSTSTTYHQLYPSLVNWKE